MIRDKLFGDKTTYMTHTIALEFLYWMLENKKQRVQNLQFIIFFSFKIIETNYKAVRLFGALSS